MDNTHSGLHIMVGNAISNVEYSGSDKIVNCNINLLHINFVHGIYLERKVPVSNRKVLSPIVNKIYVE
jgi:hypothetical protein